MLILEKILVGAESGHNALQMRRSTLQNALEKPNRLIILEVCRPDAQTSPNPANDIKMIATHV